MGKSSIEEVAEENNDTTKNAGKTSHLQREHMREMGLLVNGDSETNTKRFEDDTWNKDAGSLSVALSFFTGRRK